MSRQLTKKEAQQQQVQSQNQYARDTETQEHHASAKASAGLNLNLAGALSGVFTSKSKKTTHQNADGSSDCTEDRLDQGAVNAAASGHGSAYAQGSADEGVRKQKVREVGQGQQQAQISGTKQARQVDHLGIEG